MTKAHPAPHHPAEGRTGAQTAHGGRHPLPVGALCHQNVSHALDQIRKSVWAKADASGTHMLHVDEVISIIEEFRVSAALTSTCGESERRCDLTRRTERATANERRRDHLLRLITLPLQPAIDAMIIDREVFRRLSNLLQTVIGPRPLYAANNKLRALLDDLPIPDRRAHGPAADVEDVQNARWLEVTRHPGARDVIEPILVNLADQHRTNPMFGSQLRNALGGNGPDGDLLVYLLFAPLFHRNWSAEEVREFQRRYHKFTPAMLKELVFTPATPAKRPVRGIVRDSSVISLGGNDAAAEVDTVVSTLSSKAVRLGVPVGNDKSEALGGG